MRCTGKHSNLALMHKTQGFHFSKVLSLWWRRRRESRKTFRFACWKVEWKEYAIAYGTLTILQWRQTSFLTLQWLRQFCILTQWTVKGRHYFSEGCYAGLTRGSGTCPHGWLWLHSCACIAISKILFFMKFHFDLNKVSLCGSYIA